MSVNSKMTAIANEVRELAGSTDKLGLDAIATHTNEANAEIDVQVELIEQIKTSLIGKTNCVIPTQEKTVDITENGTTEITPDEGYALSKVTAKVNVPIPEGYIQPSGTKEITENGPHDVTEYETVNVNVESSGGEVVDEGTNTQWFADLIRSGSKRVEIYNDKVSGTLEAYAFYYNTNVSKIELPNISYLQERSFYYCSSLKTLLLPGVIGYTYQYMADGCTALETVDIHNASFISSYTFRNCSKLTKLDLHMAGTISTNSFYGCTKLETLILRMGTVPSLGGTSAFTNTKIAGSGGYIYVPRTLDDGSDGVAAYEAATNWSTYSGKFRAIEDYPDICG